MVDICKCHRRQEAGQDEPFQYSAYDLLAAFGTVDVREGLWLRFLGITDPTCKEIQANEGKSRIS
jgi:hypothetical protein